MTQREEDLGHETKKHNDLKKKYEAMRA